VEPVDLGLPKLTYEDIKGGTTVEESSRVFMDILEGKGTAAQNAAVVANAGMALYTGNQKDGIVPAVQKAKEALQSGKALRAFKKLMEVNN
jgi:anthranilate phosphoribosyltransferase